MELFIVCVGIGVFLVCASKAWNIFVSTKMNRKRRQNINHINDDAIDPLEQRLNDIRNMKFSKSMFHYRSKTTDDIPSLTHKLKRK